MPIRQNILRKGKAPKQNLLGFDVFQEETGVLGDLTTSKFFKISDFPSVLPTGNSSFLIEGSNLLKPDIELKTELLDSAGNPIFHYAIPNYDKELPARRITIEVYQDDVVNGIGSFTVLGELDPTKVNIPVAFQNTYNIRFTAPISINKTIKNTEPIRFYGDPRVTVSELVKGVIQPVYTGNQRTKTITGSVSLNVSTPSTAEYGAVGSTTADSTQIEEVGNSQAAYISQNVGEAQSSILGNSSVKSKPYSTYVVEAMEKGVDNDDNKITSTMKGATFSITRPDLLVDGTTYPDAKFTKPTTFSTKILDVLNSTTFTTTTQYKIKSKTNNQELVVPLNASASNSTITHNVGSVVRTASTVFQRSFANVTVGNLRTFSGDTYKAKIYAKEDGSSGEFEKIYETLVESPNELVDQNSNSGFKSVGIFATQSIVDNFWVSSSNTFTATQDDDTLIDGILLSGSTEPNGNSFTFETSQSYSLEKNEPYLVDFNVAFKPQNKIQSDGTTKKDAKLEVFLTGTFLSETSQEVTLGEVDLGEYDFNKINTFTKVEKRQVSDFLTHDIEGGVATGSLGFRLHSGEFILSDVRLRPFSETNFSPGFFKANVPMPPAIKRGQPYDFVVEFYDANNSLAEAVAVADDIVFAGPRQVLGDGNDGVLTGSVFLSNTEDTGIEFHGGSAYIRSIGFNGFERARDEGTSGFMMFSGSVSKSLNTSESYDGVGIEIISGSKGSDFGDKFLQFRTNDGDTPAVFKVQTDDFFLGNEGQFVSGSNGNIEISSSNLHINSNGQITGSNVLFSGGTITSDVTIQGSVAANSILTPATIAGAAANVGNASASIDDNGNAVFRSGSIGGFSLTDTEISASGLSLKSSGQITGSNILITGGTITSDVTIQGSVAANSILVPATIAGAASNVGNASASIDDEGNAVFRSGSIGGFAFTSTVLTASKFELDTANEKLTLGSDDSVFVADSGDGIHLGNATFGSAPFRVNMGGELTATSVTITGNLTATAGPVSSSLTSLGIKTGSLQSSASLASSSLESVKIITGSLQGSASLASSSLESVKLTTGSLEEASGSFVASASLAASTGSSLTVASESMQKQFRLIDDNTLNLQNARGGILSSFSDYAKFFGSASNALVTSSDNGTVNYTEINDKGFLVVTGSSTASFFGNVTTIGDTTAQHISIAPDSLSIKTANNVTVLSASATGLDMAGNINAAGGTIGGFEIGGSQINSSNDALILKDSGQITGSSVQLTGEINASSGTTATSITALGIATSSLSGSVEAINTETGSLISSSAAATTTANVGVSSSAAVTSDVADTRAQLVLDNSAANNQKINLVNTTGGIMSSFGKGVKFFGSASNALVTSSANGTVNYSEINDKGFLIVTGSATASFFGNTTTIGDTDDTHVRISGSGLELRDGTTQRIGIHANGMKIGTGIILDSDGDATFSGDLSAAGGTFSGQLVIGGSNTSLTSDAIAGALAANISGSGIETSASAASAHSSSKELRTQVVLDPNGMSLKNAAANKTLATYGATSKIFDGENANTFVEVGGNGIVIVSGSITGSSFGAATSSFFGTGSNKHDRIEIVGDGLSVYKNNEQVAKFGGSTEIGKLEANSPSKLQIDSTGKLSVLSGSTTIFEVGTINISEPVILGDGRLAAGTAATQAVMNAPTMSSGLIDSTNVSVGKRFVQAITNLDSSNQAQFGFTESSSAEGNGNQPGNYKINHYSVHDGSAGTTSDSEPGFQFNYTHASNVADSTKLSRFTGGVFDLNVLVESFTGTSHKPADKEFAALMINVDDNTATSGEDGYSFIHAKGSTNNGSITDKFQVSSSGDVVAAGNITAFGTAFASVSDRSWKKDIETFSGSLNRILELRPRKFKWRKDDTEDYGFIAQEVEEIIPHIVRNQGFSKAGKGTGGQQHKTIDYAKLTPYLVDTIQELTKRIEKLEKKVK